MMIIRENAALVILAAGLLIILACSNSGSGDSGNVPGNIEGFVLEDASAVIMMDVDALLNAVDAPFAEAARFGLVSDAEDFEDALDDWRDAWEDDDDALGAALDEVTDIMYVGSESTEQLYTVVKGDFDFSDIRAELDDQDFDDGTYRGRELWEKNDSEAFALFDTSGVFVGGSKDSVREVVKAVQRDEGFANFENNVIISVREKVSEGLFFFGTDNCFSTTFDSGALKNCESLGLSITGGNEDQAEISGAALFSSERRAESGMDDVEDLIEDDDDLDVDLHEIKVDGEFVIFKVTIYE